VVVAFKACLENGTAEHHDAEHWADLRLFDHLANA